MFERLKQFPPGLRKSAPLLILFGFTLALIVYFVVGFVARERFIYFWDYWTYYHLFADLGRKFADQPLKALDSINVSMRKSEYNNTGVVPLMPFYFIFGAGRAAYVAAVAVVYGFSTIVFFPALLKKITGFDGGARRIEKLLFFALAIALLGLLPQFWIPVLLGYYDVGGVGLIFLILYFYFRKGWREQTTKNLIVIGLTVFALVIFRRWYAYWPVGFFAALAAREIFSFLAGGRDLKNLKTGLKNILIAGAASALVYFALATQIAVRMLKTDYGVIYSAYRSNAGVFEDLSKLYGYFGTFTMLLALGGAARMLASKALRARALFLGVLFAVTFYSFTRTQDMDFHHYYWALSILIIFAAVFAVETFRRLESLKSQTALVSVLLLLSAANFATVFSGKAGTFLSPVEFLFSKARLAPKVRNDLDELHRLLRTLDELTRARRQMIYVLSSSTSLNSSILIVGCEQFEPELLLLKERIFYGHDVDKRDGFPFQLYEADFVVVADPPGYHLRPGDQKIVGVLAEQFIKGQTVGGAFKKLPAEFTLDDASKVFIYQKERKYTADELMSVSRMFTGFYPEQRAKFEISAEMIGKFIEN
ncbi:MAG TPA: hypothetical protein VIL74_17980 [Pyrinomonadaceae bacterium]|jgi:hypothetical protein